MKTYPTALISILLLGTALACGKQSEEDSKNTTSPNELEANQVPVTGTLALQTLRLAGADVSHVVALNVETGATVVSAVDVNGNFELALEKEEPWVLSYVDDSRTGKEMIVSTFASETLDTLNAAADSEGVEMGSVDVSTATAGMDIAAGDFLAAIKMSATAAATMGSVDDVSRRYSNPDIDTNGKIDAVEGKSYMIDFHNRFNARSSTGSALSILDMKNAFYPADTTFTYTGTGIMPQIPKTDLNGTAPGTYKWTFSVNMPVASNGGSICTGLSSGSVIPAGTACELNHTSNTGANGDNFTFSLETSLLKAGDYKLEAGGKTFHWTNVAVSDFSAGKGFLALFLRIDVDTAEKITGVSYKWMKKTTSGYTLATVEEVRLLVKTRNDSTFGGHVSLKYQGDESKGGLGVGIPVTQAEGSVVLATALKADDGSVNVGGSVLTKQMVIDGLPFSDFTTNPGIGYDDKLGMRFFF